MTRKQFFQDFVLRTMTNPAIAEINEANEEKYVQWAISLAKKSWDAIEAMEAEKEVSPEELRLKEAPADESLSLKDLALKAISESKGLANFIAIDSNGIVTAYDKEPVILGDSWLRSSHHSSYWCIAKVSKPTYFAKECYRIDTIIDAPEMPYISESSPSLPQIPLKSRRWPSFTQRWGERP